MTDIYTKDKRSKIMSNIGSVSTKPEIIIRKSLFSKGFRYRINYKKLPGKPDIVLPKLCMVVFGMLTLIVKTPISQNRILNFGKIKYHQISIEIKTI